MKTRDFRGSMVAIVTPFSAKGGGLVVDEKTLVNLVDWQIKNGTEGIVPSGTTGESPTLSYEEHERVIEIVVEAVKGRVPVIAGTGSNSTLEAIALTKHAKKVGADASLQVSPYYNRPTQEGLFRHFRTISQEVDIPIILYNIASRTGVNIEPETMARIARECPNIIGVKEASGSLDQMSRIKALCCKDFILLSGDDSLTLPVLSIGGEGVISVAANIVPKDIRKLCDDFRQSRTQEAQELHYKLLPLIKALFLETNPIPLKEAMGILGLCSADLRLPLCPMSAKNLELLKTALKDYGLISKR
jgi:4-hydroxy-tetrahydrodipicolinate synthase